MYKIYAEGYNVEEGGCTWQPTRRRVVDGLVILPVTRQQPVRVQVNSRREASEPDRLGARVVPANSTAKLKEPRYYPRLF
jgi:hypothetical protein